MLCRNPAHLIRIRKRDHPIGHLERMAGGRRPDQAEEPRLGDRTAVGGRCGRVGEVQGAQSPPQGHQADQHAEVAHAIDDEGLVGRG